MDSRTVLGSPCAPRVCEDEDNAIARGGRVSRGLPGPDRGRPRGLRRVLGKGPRPPIVRRRTMTFSPPREDDPGAVQLTLRQTSASRNSPGIGCPGARADSQEFERNPKNSLEKVGSCERIRGAPQTLPGDPSRPAPGFMQIRQRRTLSGVLFELSLFLQ